MKKFIFTLICLYTLALFAEDQNIVDKAECAAIEAGDKLDSFLNDPPKDGKKAVDNPCKGEIPPVSERLDKQLTKDAKTIKNFLGIDQEESKP